MPKHEEKCIYVHMSIFKKKIKDIEFKNIQWALEAKSAAAKSSSRSLSDSPGIINNRISYQQEIS